MLENNKPSRLCRAKAFCAKWGARLLIVQAGLSAPSIANHAYHTLMPSDAREEFKREFGFAVISWSEQFEGLGKSKSELGSILLRESAGNISFVKALSLEPSFHFRKSPLDQLLGRVCVPLSGYYIPILNLVSINPESSPSVLTHELKHAKTFEALRKQPRFRSEWESLAVDAKGRSLYIDKGIELLSKVRGLEKLVSLPLNSDENFKLGFITNYARTNFYEDVAELAQAAEDKVEYLMQYLFRENYSPVIWQKLKLLQEYSIIPREFSEYLQLRKSYEEATKAKRVPGRQLYKQFIQQSNSFITSHPNSVYSIHVRLSRSNAINELSHEPAEYWSGKPHLHEDANKELVMAINSEYKELNSYKVALGRLSSDHYLPDSARSAYKLALNNFDTRLETGDLLLAKHGTNYAIKAYGISHATSEQVYLGCNGKN